MRKLTTEEFIKRDVKKRETARKNKLNYVTLWNKQDIEDWFNLGCPDDRIGKGSIHGSKK